MGGTEAQFQPAPAAGAGAFEPVGRAENGGDGSANPRDRRARPHEAKATKQGPPIIREIPQFVQQVPPALKFALAVTGVLAVLLALAGFMTTMRNRSLARQRRELLQEVGLLQSALLPPVPGPGRRAAHLGGLPPGRRPRRGRRLLRRAAACRAAASASSSATCPATAAARSPAPPSCATRLRAYLEAGLEPRVALQVAGRVIDENLGGDFATVLLAVHDPETGSLTYATAGHPAPIVVGPQPHEPVTAGSSPPIGVGRAHRAAPDDGAAGARLGRRMFTDGLHGGPRRGRHARPRPARGAARRARRRRHRARADRAVSKRGAGALRRHRRRR